MSRATDYAFDIPVHLRGSSGALIRTVEQAISLLRATLQQRFTIEGLNTLLMLERAADGCEIDAARQAFRSWAAHEGLRGARAS
jgi:hypothetical protein